MAGIGFELKKLFRREEMGRIGQRRVDAYFHHEQMLANYRKMYDETAKEYHLE